MYGFLEFYYNGIGTDSCEDLFIQPELMVRVARGELFTIGRAYLAGHVKVELHPLVNVLLTVTGNLEDGSGAIQPRAVWDIASNLQLTAGANIYYGGKGTEYGGIEIPLTGLFYAPPDSAYLWMTFFF